VEICRAALVEGHAHARAGNPRGLGSKPLDRFHIELGGGSHRERQSDATLRGSFRTRPNGRLGSRPTSSTFPGREISRSTRMGASLSSAPGFGAGSAIPILGHLGCSFSAEGSSRPSMPLATRPSPGKGPRPTSALSSAEGLLLFFPATTGRPATRRAFLLPAPEPPAPSTPGSPPPLSAALQRPKDGVRRSPRLTHLPRRRRVECFSESSRSNTPRGQPHLLWPPRRQALSLLAVAVALLQPKRGIVRREKQMRIGRASPVHLRNPGLGGRPSWDIL